jgi:hypothetical protein
MTMSRYFGRHITRDTVHDQMSIYLEDTFVVQAVREKIKRDRIVPKSAHYNVWKHLDHVICTVTPLDVATRNENRFMASTRDQLEFFKNNRKKMK